TGLRTLISSRRAARAWESEIGRRREVGAHGVRAGIAVRAVAICRRGGENELVRARRELREVQLDGECVIDLAGVQLGLGHNPALQRRPGGCDPGAGPGTRIAPTGPSVVVTHHKVSRMVGIY